MHLKEKLLQDPALEFDGDIFLQRGAARPGKFETVYLELRHIEGRAYPDKVVRSLPAFAKGGSLDKEWAIRAASLAKLRNYLMHDRSPKTIFELGCGNGWLANSIAESLDAEVCAMDVNYTELQQGARVFATDKNLSFVYGDIFTLAFPDILFDVIVMAASIQYFQNLKTLIARLCKLLSNHGRIYILDTPIYASNQVQDARQRSQQYFDSKGVPAMASHYFHHTFDDLEGFDYTIRYDPRSLTALIRRKVLQFIDPVFPIVMITRDAALRDLR
jgi:ubiquinone/menaquinone biosynthesis C-methylase UbiE